SFRLTATSTSRLYSLSLHDALPISGVVCAVFSDISVEAGESELLTRFQLVYLAPLMMAAGVAFTLVHGHYDTWQQRDHYEAGIRDRKSTRLNSSHRTISYAVFCLKK